MRCEVAREALSARIDGERETVPSIRVDEHLAGCAECADWFAALQTFSIPSAARSLRVVGAGEDPDDLVAAVLAAAPA
ncbi:MAG: zf-HC2 domain-containing protein, partial [Gordonia sp. (in: high G+C Gram-positive bacteria)]